MGLINTSKTFTSLQLVSSQQRGQSSQQERWTPSLPCISRPPYYKHLHTIDGNSKLLYGVSGGEKLC